MRLLVLLALVGCVDYDAGWQIRVGIPAQPLARADVAVADQAVIAPGDAWIAIHSYGTADVVYPIADDGEALMVESPFEPLRDDPHAALLTMTRLSQDTEPAEHHPDQQYATIMIDAIVAPNVRGALAAGTRQELTIELEVPSAGTCTSPATMVSGTVTGCLAGGNCSTGRMTRPTTLYQAGPIALSIEVLDQECLE